MLLRMFLMEKNLQTWLVSPSQMRMVYMGVSIAMGVLWNGFIMENPSINGWFGGSSISGNLHITYKTGWWMCDVDTSSSSIFHILGMVFPWFSGFPRTFPKMMRNSSQRLPWCRRVSAQKIAVWPAPGMGVTQVNFWSETPSIFAMISPFSQTEEMGKPTDEG